MYFVFFSQFKVVLCSTIPNSEFRILNSEFLFPISYFLFPIPTPTPTPTPIPTPVLIHRFELELFRAVDFTEAIFET
jgi:hypothetical protein